MGDEAGLLPEPILRIAVIITFAVCMPPVRAAQQPVRFRTIVLVRARPIWCMDVIVPLVRRWLTDDPRYSAHRQEQRHRKGQRQASCQRCPGLQLAREARVARPTVEHLVGLVDNWSCGRLREGEERNVPRTEARTTVTLLQPRDQLQVRHMPEPPAAIVLRQQPTISEAQGRRAAPPAVLERLPHGAITLLVTVGELRVWPPLLSSVARPQHLFAGAGRHCQQVHPDQNAHDSDGGCRDRIEHQRGTAREVCAGNS
mmetsp:Transcript_56190/g.156497  ORF Transcript_56190/g.156497 Transcript_56190/m.156497 type:complete len:257 (+) Transcript_56190:62-832(+)